jgi:hypothetical protein
MSGLRAGLGLLLFKSVTGGFIRIISNLLTVALASDLVSDNHVG